jgi:hypothetical protein
MSKVLTYDANRERIKLGDVGIVKLAGARDQPRNISQSAHSEYVKAPATRPTSAR